MKRHKSTSPMLKEITHLRHFFENLVNNFHNTVFHSLFRNTIALWLSASKFTVCGRDEVEASNCEF